MLFANDIKWPVFYLRYYGGTGSEESEDGELSSSSRRNSVSLRVKEELSRTAVANLWLFYSRKIYLAQSGSYAYFYAKPALNVDITDRFSFDTSLRTKWTAFDELDADGLPKDYMSLSSSVSSSFKPVRSTRLESSLQGSFDWYDNPVKSRQAYTFLFRITTVLNKCTLGSYYRGIARFPFGNLSNELRRFTGEFGANFSWDPNE
jgi:hypothetical protein